MIRGKTISNIDFFEKENEGKKEWFANIYYNNSKTPIRVPKKDAIAYLEAMAEANDIDPKDNKAISQLAEKGLFNKISEEEADRRLVTDWYNKKGTKVHHKLNKKAVMGTLAIGTAVALLATGIGSCHRENKYDQNADGLSDAQYYGSSFADLIAKLQAGPKKDAVMANQLVLKNFNDSLSGNIMREGEDKRLAHSWDENIAAYLAFNQFTDEELFQIFDTYKIDGKALYEELKLGNMKEMLYYARATEPSGRVDLIKSEEGKQFFTKYENKLLEFNKADTKEAKIVAAKEFYTMVRADFPIQEEDKVGFIHTDKGYEDYSYAVTPMISAMEVMTRNVGVSLNNAEVKYFNELGMCNFAEEKLETYQTQLESRQNVAIAKEELRAEYEAVSNSEGSIEVTKTISYEKLREAGIASIEHYDLSAEKNDVGTIEGYFEDATMDTAKKQQIINNKNNGTISTSTSNYHKTLTENDLKKESSKVQQQAQQQKDEINKQYDKQNQQAKEESDKKKAEIEKEIEEDKKKLEEEIKNDNAWMNEDKNTTPSNPSSGSSSEEAPGRPSRDDVDDHIDIDDDYVDKDGNLEFDGPIYDKDGNIIDNPSANKQKAKTTTYAGTSFVQSSSGLYVPSSAAEVNSYVDSLADQNSNINQNTNSNIIK